MALIAGIGFFIVSVLVAVLSRLLAEEFGAWTPTIISGLIKLAVGRLPQNKRERFEEEWHAHVNDVPGQLGKFLVAMDFLRAAYGVAVSEWHDQTIKDLSCTVAEIDEAILISTNLVGIIQSGPLASAQVMNLTDERRRDVEHVVAAISVVDSSLRETKIHRDRLAKLIAAASDGSRGPFKYLATLVLYRARSGDVMEQISQSVGKIKESGIAAMKTLQEYKN
jgi:hypothetical protein